MCTHTYTHANIHAQTYTHTQTHTSTHTHADTGTHQSTNMDRWTETWRKYPHKLTRAGRSFSSSMDEKAKTSALSFVDSSESEPQF